ncbi:MAG: DUF3047 domain-containing protein [Proteobacteria bacterium]|nr:DUF3047 domain-containing protein [Pseudomonadota bacterium]
MVENLADQEYNELMSTFRQHVLSRQTLLAFFIAAFFIFLAVPLSYSQGARILFREDFNNLENWRPIYFPKISRHTAYTVETNGGKSFLKAESNASASALVYKEDFNIYDYPQARWRWKVNNVYQNAVPETKSGDDYPIRVYIIFKYDPETAHALDKVKYGIAKKLYGEYPPHSTLIYVWANSDEQKQIMTSPYTDKARLIALEKGKGRVGIWQQEEVNILQDYRAAFGADPPASASIAIMNDSDNTGQASVSYLGFIEVFKDVG